jgi:Ca-activated chloride channel homolog
MIPASWNEAWRFTLLGYKLGLAQPAFLLGFLVVLALFALATWVVLRRTKRLAQSIPTRLHEALAPGVSVLRPTLQNVSFAGALCLFTMALAQPQCGEKAEVVKRRGIDVVVALDASKSMYARDVAPSRIERAKFELSTMLDMLKGDRVGIVAFAGDAFVQCPLTSDYAAAKLFLRAIDPETMPQGGTNIGAALMIAKDLFEAADRGSKDKVVVLLSDGEDLSNDLSDGISAIKEAGAKVVAVGLGDEAGQTIPLVNNEGKVLGYKKDEAGNTVITRLDSAGLKRIASETGGAYFYEPKGVAIGEVVKLIDGLQKSELESRVSLKYGEAFQPFVVAGLVLMLLGFLLLPSWRNS